MTCSSRSGAAAIGFRAPGYTLSARLLRAVVARGHAYDASIFPPRPYWAAKALTLGWLRLRGRRSSAILDRPRIPARASLARTGRTQTGPSAWGRPAARAARCR
jgi:hypothetical protein